jgi:hypothetical protein
MDLEELRKQVEEEESAEVEAVDEVETVADEPEPEQEAEESEPESEDESESDEPVDFDFEIDSEEPKKPKHTPQEAMLYKLTKKSKQLKGAKTEIEQLREEIEALKTGQAPAAAAPVAPEPKPEVIPFPDLYDPTINGDKQKYSQAGQQGQVTAQQQQLAAKQAQTEKERALRLAGRTAKFITDNKVNEDKAAEAVQAGVEALDALTGIPGGGLYLLDSVGDDSEKLALYFGKDPSRLNQVREWLEEDTTGLKAIAQMTRLVTTKLKPRASKSKKSLEPDEPLKGSTSTKSASDLQRRYDAENDLDKLMAIRKEAKSKGVTLT